VHQPLVADWDKIDGLAAMDGMLLQCCMELEDQAYSEEVPAQSVPACGPACAPDSGPARAPACLPACGIAGPQEVGRPAHVLACMLACVPVCQHTRLHVHSLAREGVGGPCSVACGLLLFCGSGSTLYFMDLFLCVCSPISSTCSGADEKWQLLLKAPNHLQPCPSSPPLTHRSPSWLSMNAGADEVVAAPGSGPPPEVWTAAAAARRPPRSPAGG